ncbi:MAG: GtrA family protein [Clostridiales bacterium]|nr:GtrA family protein [Clostridiales bacterium]
MMQDTAVLIPVFHAEETVVNKVKELTEAGYSVFCVCPPGMRLFSSCKMLCTLAEVFFCEEGMGRTEAILGGLAILIERSSFSFVITMEPDERYHANTVLQLQKELYRYPDQLIIGSHEYPDRSPGRRAAYFAAGMSYRFIAGERVYDLQTGLLGFSSSHCRELLTLMEKRKAQPFEISAILSLCLHGTKTREVALDEISSVIQERPINKRVVQASKTGTDISVNRFGDLCKCLLSYIFISRFSLFAFSSLLAFLVDWSVFELLHIELSKTTLNESFITLTAQLIARLISATLNFWVNYRFVFKSKERVATSAIRYSSTVIFILCLQVVLMYWMDTVLSLSVTYTPLLVQACTFFINYLIQKKMVYKPSKITAEQ